MVLKIVFGSLLEHNQVLADIEGEFFTVKR